LGVVLSRRVLDHTAAPRDPVEFTVRTAVMQWSTVLIVLGNLG
jgi:hypothetical protein